LTVSSENIKELLRKRYPPNFIIRSPFTGTLILMIFLLCFALIYRPHQAHEARTFPFYFTMILYCTALAVPVLVFNLILNRIYRLTYKKEWNITRELLSDIFLLFLMGVSAYFAGFIIETPTPRWNLATFFDSLMSVVLIGMIPVLVFTLINIRYLLTPETSDEFAAFDHTPAGESHEKQIHIISKAKKEELSFLPSEFIYAESDGNYVIFHLFVREQLKEVMIRNSISEIDQQLSAIPFFMRIHRAFIVNLKKVSSKSGNSLGYQLKLAGSNNKIPVSRQNTRKFDQLIRQH
jgi:hypothetical protein